MNWTPWILSSAVFLALYDLAKKASVRENAVLPVLLCSTLFGSAAFVAGMALTGNLGAAVSVVDGRTVLLSAVKVVIVASSWVFTFCALRSLPITVATPIRASAPALVFVAALFLYGERPTFAQGLGLALVFGGYWLFSWAGRHEGIDFLRNRAVWLAVAGMCLSATSAIWDKYVFQVAKAPVEAVQLLFQLGLVLAYGVSLLVFRMIFATCAPIRPRPFRWRWTIPFVGVLLALADWLYFRGLAIPDVPISLASMARRFSVAITFVLGALFFHEVNLRRKGLALVLVLAGLALLCRWR